jgi:hypothetical protein
MIRTIDVVYVWNDAADARSRVPKRPPRPRLETRRGLPTVQACLVWERVIAIAVVGPVRQVLGYNCQGEGEVAG